MIAGRSKPREGELKRLVIAGLIGGLLLPVCVLAAELQFLEEEGEGDFNLSGRLQIQEPAKLSAQILFNYQPDKRHYLLTLKDGRVSLALMEGRKIIPLGVPAAVTLPPSKEAHFILQRRDWRIAFIWNGRVLLRAYEATLHDGKIGLGITGGAFADVAVQPVGEMFVADDFVREEGAQSPWQPVLGKWELHTLRDDPQAGHEEAEKSANAFSFLGTGEPRALAIGGYNFWDRYNLEASVKPRGRGAVGLAFYYQDDKNYLLLRWTSLADAPPHGNKLQLVAVHQGQEKVLAEKEGGYEPGQWAKLCVRTCDGIVQALVDDEIQLQTQTTLFGQGQIGLYVEGQAGAFFDDVDCQEWDMFRETFAQSVPGKWRAEGWIQKDGVLSYKGKGRSLCVAGSKLWQRYTAQADVSVSAVAGAGLAFCYTGPKNYCVLRYAPPKAQTPYAGKLQLVRFTEQGSAVLAECPFTGRGDKIKLQVRVEEGLLTGLCNDKVRLQAVAPGVSSGAIGLYADGAATFDNVELMLLRPRKGAHITREFTETDQHPEMASWASTKAPWVPPSEGKDEWWSKGDYFGDTSIAFRIPEVGKRSGTARAVLGAEPGQSSGVALLITATENSSKLRLSVLAADKELQKAEVEVNGEARIVFSRESRLFIVWVNEQPVLQISR